MKIQQTSARWLLSGLVIGGIAITLLAWAGNPQNKDEHPGIASDTVPAKERSGRQPGDRDLDREIRELENARIHLEELKNKDWEKIRRDIEISLEKIDFDKINLDVQKALQEIDIEKIQRDVEAAISKIDFNKIEKEIESVIGRAHVSIDKAEMEKIKSDLDKVRQEIRVEFNAADFKKEMEQIKKIDLKEIEKDLEAAKKDIEKARKSIELDKFEMKIDLENARKDIAEARVELKGYQEMIYEMENEGLLSTKGDYSISFKDGELLVNGVKQSSGTTTKYKKYFRRNITLEKKNGRIEMDHHEQKRQDQQPA